MDVTSSVVDLGNASALSGAVARPASYAHIREYNNRLYLGGHRGLEQNFVYYQLPNGPFNIERYTSGVRLVVPAEKINKLQITDDYDLLISTEDGEDNRVCGLQLNDVAEGWRFRKTPYDNVHGHGQHKFKDLFFATYGNNPNFQNSPATGPAIVVSTDDLATWNIVGDSNNDFSTLDNRTSLYFYELKGHLFSSGFYSSSPWVISGWLTHYTGDAEHSFEIAHDTSSDFHSLLNENTPFGKTYIRIEDMLELGGEKGILLTGSEVFRLGFTTVSGRNGEYPRPDGETRISTTARTILRKNGIGYILECSGTTVKVRWSSDLINWNTLFTSTKGGGSFTRGLEIANGNVFYAGGTDGKNIYRVPGASFGGLPTGFNAAPVANVNSYSTDTGTPIVINAGKQGILPDDTDGNGDKLSSSLVTGRPRHAQSPGQRTFHLHPGSGLWRYGLLRLFSKRWGRR